MKFTPKRLEGNVNVSRTHPLAELFWLLGGLVLVTALVFFALGFSADWAASKAQESAADSFGLELLNQRYGHAGGSTDFFARMAKKAGGRIPYLLASHPHPEARIERLEALIAKQGYKMDKTLPLALDLRISGD